MTQPKTLSSPLTPIAKTLFPLVWLLTFGVLTLAGFLPDQLSGLVHDNSSLATRIIMILILVAGARGVFHHFIPLKCVRMNDELVYVSNLIREIAIPLEEVRDVQEYRAYNLKRIVLLLDNPTPFGNRIIFMPKTHYLGLLSQHPVVDQIRSEVARARRRNRSSR